MLFEKEEWMIGPNGPLRKLTFFAAVASATDEEISLSFSTGRAGPVGVDITL